MNNASETDYWWDGIDWALSDAVPGKEIELDYEVVHYIGEYGEPLEPPDKFNGSIDRFYIDEGGFLASRFDPQLPRDSLGFPIYTPGMEISMTATYKERSGEDGYALTVGPTVCQDIYPATLSFKLNVEGKPPEDTKFIGLLDRNVDIFHELGLGEYITEVGLEVPLTDPEGDGIYTGSIEVPRYPPGKPLPRHWEPEWIWVYIAQRTGEQEPPVEMIQSFGEEWIRGDQEYEATAIFRGDGSGSGNKGDGGSDKNGGGSSNNGGTDGGILSGIVSGILPETGGGWAILLLIVGVVLVGGGWLLVRRFSTS